MIIKFCMPRMHSLLPFLPHHTFFANNRGNTDELVEWLVHFFDRYGTNVASSNFPLISITRRRDDHI